MLTGCNVIVCWTTGVTVICSADANGNFIAVAFFTRRLKRELPLGCISDYQSLWSLATVCWHLRFDRVLRFCFKPLFCLKTRKKWKSGETNLTLSSLFILFILLIPDGRHPGYYLVEICLVMWVFVVSVGCLKLYQCLRIYINITQYKAKLISQ